MNELRWILLGIGLVLLVLIYLFSRRSPAEDDTLPSRHEPTLSDDNPPESSSTHVPSFESASESRVSLEARSTIGDDRGSTASAESAEEAVLRRRGSSRFDSRDVRSSTTLSEAVEAAAEPAAGEHRANSEPPFENTSTPVVPEKVIALHLMPKSDQVFDGIDFVGAVQAEGLKFGRFDIFHRFKDPDDITESTPSQFSLANMIKPGTFSLTNLDQQQFKGASLFLVLPGPEDAVAAFADMVATGRRLAATLDGQLLDAQGTVLSRQSASHLREDIINYQHGLSATSAE